MYPASNYIGQCPWRRDYVGQCRRRRDYVGQCRQRTEIASANVAGGAIALAAVTHPKI